ncbi:MAG: heavy-metal-associated domain-containing protein [Lachnospiraceae bacterium]
MVKTVLKVDGMSCGMCESHMNNLVRSLFRVKKVSSSAKDGETVGLGDKILDIPYLKIKMKGIGYKLVSVQSTHEA